jgi:hypothetical protein
VGPICCLKAVEKRKTSFPCRELNTYFSVFLLTSQAGFVVNIFGMHYLSRIVPTSLPLKERMPNAAVR